MNTYLASCHYFCSNNYCAYDLHQNSVLLQIFFYVYNWIRQVIFSATPGSYVNVYQVQRHPVCRFVFVYRYISDHLTLFISYTEQESSMFCLNVSVYGVISQATMWLFTRWFKYDRDWLCINKSQFVPVIFEPPCTNILEMYTIVKTQSKISYKYRHKIISIPDKFNWKLNNLCYP